MNTIRLPATSRLRRPESRLEWGSTDWAADSCLVGWSQLERQWLGTEVDPRVTDRRLSAGGWLLLILLAMATAFTFTWVDGLRDLLMATVTFLAPVFEAMLDLAPYVALGAGLLVLLVAVTRLLHASGDAPDGPR